MPTSTKTIKELNEENKQRQILLAERDAAALAFKVAKEADQIAKAYYQIGQLPLTINTLKHAKAAAESQLEVAKAAVEQLHKLPAAIIPGAIQEPELPTVVGGPPEDMPPEGQPPVAGDFGGGGSKPRDPTLDDLQSPADQ